MTTSQLTTLAAMIRRGELISAVKFVRSETGCGLLEGKNIVEEFIAAGESYVKNRDASRVATAAANAWPQYPGSTSSDDHTYAAFTRASHDDHVWTCNMRNVSRDYARDEAQWALNRGAAEAVVCKVVVNSETKITLVDV